jgi:hypothetical protein
MWSSKYLTPLVLLALQLETIFEKKLSGNMYQKPQKYLYSLDWSSYSWKFYPKE